MAVTDQIIRDVLASGQRQAEARNAFEIAFGEFCGDSKKLASVMRRRRWGHIVCDGYLLKLDENHPGWVDHPIVIEKVAKHCGDLQ